MPGTGFAGAWGALKHNRWVVSAQICRGTEGLGDRQELFGAECQQGPSPGTSLLRWLGTEGSVDPGSSGPCRRHALALPGALTLKGHGAAEQACVSLRPQTGVEGQTDNVRGRNTALKQLGRRQILPTPGSPQNSGSHYWPLTATFPADMGLERLFPT